MRFLTQSATVKLISFAFGLMVGFAFFLNGSRPIEAQTFDPEVERKKDERDKTVTAEKLERVRAETVVIRDSILELMKKHFPKYELINSAISDPGNQGSGRRGQSTLEYEWKKGKSRLVLQIAFVFSPNEAQAFHLRRLNGIAMGEGSSAPQLFGTDAVLIKNVHFNKSMTWVALHFRRGRLLVSADYNSGSRTTTENEKELLKIIEAIYPLLVAKETFDEL
jgi:hypothetical protein